MMYGVSQLAYLVASALFIFALHWMNTPATARKGVYAGVAGTAIAVVVTWAEPTVGSAHVTSTARAVPATPAYTPLRAVCGVFIQCSAKMKREAETM